MARLESARLGKGKYPRKVKQLDETIKIAVQREYNKTVVKVGGGGSATNIIILIIDVDVLERVRKKDKNCNATKNDYFCATLIKTKSFIVVDHKRRIRARVQECLLLFFGAVSSGKIVCSQTKMSTTILVILQHPSTTHHECSV